jgi:hypothetical protein
MPTEERSQFLLKTGLSMVFLLSGDIGFHLFDLGLAH